MRRLRLSILLIPLALMPAGNARAAEPTVPDNVQDNVLGLEHFEKRIRPVLIKHCFKCHSAEAKELKGKLRLDTRSGARRGGESGAAVVPGKVKQSLIISALEHDEFDMPPSKKLPDAVIEDFRRWIELGAPDPRDDEAAVASTSGIDIQQGRQFWAFQPPAQQGPPPVKNTAWATSDIDRFILAKIEAAGLKPSEDADRETLIRRATFALIGLPPTPEEIDAFIADRSPDAFAIVIERLLASPHFGERWARHWLDIARYAESSGGGRTLIFPNAWRYRDYVIRSFNNDKPYDQFVTEQIAGDLLPHKSPSEKREHTIATGFLALGPTNFELQDKELLRMEVIDEQLDTIGRSMLGMTIGCARCHDHKFDPIPTRDYYALAGIFGSSKTFNLGNVAQPIRVALASPEDEQRIAAHKQKVAELTERISRLDQRHKELAATIPGGDKLIDAGGTNTTPRPGVKIAELPGVVVDNSSAKLVGQWMHSTSVEGYLGDGYVHDENSGKGQKSITFATRLPRDGQYEVRISYTIGTNRVKNVPVIVHHADGESTSSVNQVKRPPIDNRFVPLGIFRFTSKKDASVRISNAGTQQYVIADAVQFLPQPGTESSDPADQPATQSAAESALAEPNSVEPDPTKPSSAEIDAAKIELQSVQDQLAPLRKQLGGLKKKAPKVSAKALTIVEDKPHDGHLLIRGGVRNRGPIVPRGVLAVATYGDPPAIPKNQSGRLELASWIASERNPLTARVMANRIWHHLMGEGLVRTPDNLGEMGQRPTHPQLLDHLAVQFADNGWSVKTLIREIMLTRTYQLASQPTREAATIDAENRLLSHAHRRRLDAEAIRDALLAVSGELDKTAFGAAMRGGTKSELGYKFNSVRRSVYVPSFRNTQLDLLSAFDAANPNVVTGRRTASTLPTQALVMMNSPTVIEQSRHTAQRLIADLPDAGDEARLTLLYRRALGRPPRPAEMLPLVAYLAMQQQEGRPAVDAWALVCQTVFACVDFRYVH